MNAYEDRRYVAAVGASSYVLGLLSLEEGDYVRAEALFCRSLDICRSGGNVLFELWVVPLLTELYLKMGQPDTAAAQVTRGFELLKPDQSWYGLSAPMYVAKGMLASAKENRDEAENSFAEAVEINRRYQLPWDEAKALYEWGLMHLASGEASQHKSP